MFSIHTKLFLALKKVRIIKITPPQVPFTREAPSFIKISDSHPPPTTGGGKFTTHPSTPLHPLLLFGKSWSQLGNKFCKTFVAPGRLTLVNCCYKDSHLICYRGSDLPLKICFLQKKCKKLQIYTHFCSNFSFAYSLFGDSTVRNGKISRPVVTQNSILLLEQFSRFYTQKCFPKELSWDISNRKLIHTVTNLQYLFFASMILACVVWIYFYK